MAAESGFPAAPRKTLSLFDACAFIVGIMLGAGVLRARAGARNPADARQPPYGVGSPCVARGR